MLRISEKIGAVSDAVDTVGTVLAIVGIGLFIAGIIAKHHEDQEDAAQAAAPAAAELAEEPGA